MRTRRLLKAISRPVRFLAIAFGFPALLWAADSERDFTLDHPKAKEVMAVQQLVTKDLMAQSEILGTAVGQDEDGEAVFVIYVNSEAKNQGEVIRALPANLRGKRVRPELTEPFRAFGKPTGGRVSHTAKQTKPIQLGTSGGWRNDLANGYCCGGTLGSLVKINGVNHILSNYHVFESDIVSGSNSRVALSGDFIIQPGLIDIGCDVNSSQNVATLVVKKALPNNNVDCSIAQVIDGAVDPSGAILEIGTISSQPVAAYVNQPVKKSGRTTGLTRSKVSGLNATINVVYDSECGGAEAFTRTFEGQIVIANKGSQFLAGGDSGSLMVEDVTANPHAIGLLYAGSSSTAIANPIKEVLTFLGATMVGK